MQFGRYSTSASGHARVGMAPKFGRLFAGAMLATAMIATPALAGDRDNNIPQLSPSLKFGVVGEVPVDCRLSQSVKRVEIEDILDDSTGGANETRTILPFTVSCNTPITVKMESRRGGLEFEGKSTPDSDFTSLIRYSANLALPGHRSVLQCESRDMAEGGAGCAGKVADPLLDGDGAIAVRTRSDGGLLQQGRYADRLTITISPALGSPLIEG